MYNLGVGFMYNTAIFYIVMSTKIIKIEGNFEVIGYYFNGELVRTIKRRVTSWK